MKKADSPRRNVRIMPRPAASNQDLRPQARALSWMASLSVAAGEIRAAEHYVLELLAWCVMCPRTAVAFQDRDG